MHAHSLGTLIAAAALVGATVPAVAQMRPAPPPPVPTAPSPAAMVPPPGPAMAPPARRIVRRQPHMSCSARMNEIRLAWEQMPASETKNQVAAAYNQANHARKAGDEAACQAAIAHIQLAR